MVLVHVEAHGRNTATTDGNGAEFPLPLKRMRPRKYRISACGSTCSCHQCVSVRAGKRQTTMAPPEDALSCAFFHPFAKNWSIRRIHPTDAPPHLLKAVASRREVDGALRVVRKRCNVKRERKLAVKLCEEFCRRLPFVRLVPVVDGLTLAFSLSVDSLFFGVRAVDSGPRHGSYES